MKNIIREAYDPSSMLLFIYFLLQQLARDPAAVLDPSCFAFGAPFGGFLTAIQLLTTTKKNKPARLIRVLK